MRRRAGADCSVKADEKSEQGAGWSMSASLVICLPLMSKFVSFTVRML